MVAKAAGGILFVGLVGTGGIAVAKPHWLGMDYMPEFHALSKDNDYTSEYSETTHFGKKYGKYLVGVTNETGKEDKNQKFWEWAFRRLSRETITQGKFTNTGEKSAIKVSKPFADKNTEDDNAEALNQVCKEAYKTKENDFKDGDKDKFQKSDVWKYCAPGALVNVADNEHVGNSKIGAGSDKTTLLSVKNSANDWFWKIRNEEFWSSKLNNNNLSGETATGDNSNESLFKTEYTKNKDDSKKKSRKTIKQLCEDAYEQETTSKSSNNSADAKKFCVLEASAS